MPQGMAYAGIADLPAQAGMDTLVVSLLIYALMGTSWHLSVGATSATSALLASSVAAAVVTATVAAGATDEQTYQAHAAAFVLVTGIVFLVAGVLRLPLRLRRLRRQSRVEFWLGLLAMLGVLFIGVLEGMLIGLLSSLVFLVYQSSRPYVASVGRVPGAPGAYSDLKRHPENLPVPGVLILRNALAPLLRQRPDGPRPNPDAWSPGQILRLTR